MKKISYVLILSVFLVTSCARVGDFYVQKPYGGPAPYGEGIHPGIDFDISIGTPIIASSDGVVLYTRELHSKETYGGGIFVRISHNEHFDTLYAHLTKVFIERGQHLKRGQLIGLSGVGNAGPPHLHFGICKIGRNCINYSQSYDPQNFWLGSKPQCFDPNKDYSNYSQKDITLPVACGDYAKALKSKTKKKD